MGTEQLSGDTADVLPAPSPEVQPYRPSAGSTPPPSVADATRPSPIRGLVHLFLPVLIIATVWLAYRSGVASSDAPPAEENEPVVAAPLADVGPTQRSSGGTDSDTDGDGDGDGPATSEEATASEQGDFSIDGPLPASESEDPSGQNQDEGDTNESRADENRASENSAGENNAGGDSAGEGTDADADAPIEVKVNTEWLLGTGNHTTSQPFLPLGTSPGGAALANADQDRNDDPGLTLQLGAGLGDTDPNKSQRWLGTPGELARVDGRASLDIWVAVKDFDDGKSGRLDAGLSVCDTSGRGCERIAQGDAVFNQSTFGNDFGRVTVNLSPASATIAPDQVLMLELAVAQESDDDLWIAYGATGYPTRLTINQ